MNRGFMMMKQIPLGTQGFTTSEQGLGMMSVGITMGKQDLYGKKNDVSKKGVAELISRSIKAGVTHFDTAQIYTNLSGMMLGSWFPTADSAEKRMKLGLSQHKGEWQVATKVMKSGKKKVVKNMCYRSLKAMGIDCVDLYYVHRVDPKIPIEITMDNYSFCNFSQTTVFAQGGTSSFPDRPVKIVVPFAPGAGTDAMGRLIAQKLGEVLSASFVVENRTGASGAIGTQYVAQQAADGYTLLLVASPFTTVAASLTTAGYDPIKSFTPVGMIASGPLVWAANNQLPANTMQELVALARQKPGVLNYGSAGAGGVNHLVLELLKAKTGTFITHIPYRGVAPAAVDMVAGEVQLVTGTIPALLPLIKDKRIKPLAVTSAKRSPALPDVPSMSEAGFQRL